MFNQFIPSLFLTPLPKLPKFALFFLSHQDQLCCPNTISCVAFHWSIVDLTRTLLDIADSYSPSIWQPSRVPRGGVGLWHPTPLSMLGFSLTWGWTGLVPTVTTTIRPYLNLPWCVYVEEYIVSSQSTAATLSYTMSVPFSTMIPEPWERELQYICST